MKWLRLTLFLLKNANQLERFRIPKSLIRNNKNKKIWTQGLPKIVEGSNIFGPDHPLPEFEAIPRLYSKENHVRYYIICDTNYLWHKYLRTGSFKSSNSKLALVMLIRIIITWQANMFETLQMNLMKKSPHLSILKAYLRKTYASRRKAQNTKIVTAVNSPVLRLSAWAFLAEKSGNSAYFYGS